MSGRRTLRYARRMLGAGAGRFAKDERGSVMALTVAFALPLAIFLFGTYNTGVGLISRMRAQNVADAAAYTSSLWQARFLNYCAYTRRQIVGNYTTIALTTCMINAANTYEGVYKAKELSPTMNSDDPAKLTTISMQMTPTYVLLKVEKLLIEALRSAADELNGYLSTSQEIMHGLVAIDTTTNIMDKVCKDASGRQKTDYRIASLISIPSSISSIGARSFGSLAYHNMIEKRAIPIDEVKKYFSLFTQAWAPSHIASLGRSKISLWGGVFIPVPGITVQDGFIASINIMSSELEVTDTNMKTEDSIPILTSWYCSGLYEWIKFKGVPIIPIFGPAWPILSLDTDPEDYKMTNSFSSTKVYEVKNPDRPKEPSSYAVVEVVENTSPYFHPMSLLPSQLLSDHGRGANPVRAFSRAKIYFRGWLEDVPGGTYHAQNLNYPFWGAKLAPITDDADLKLLAGGTLLTRALTQMPEY